MNQPAGRLAQNGLLRRSAGTLAPPRTRSKGREAPRGSTRLRAHPAQELGIDPGVRGRRRRGRCRADPSDDEDLSRQRPAHRLSIGRTGPESARPGQHAGPGTGADSHQRGSEPAGDRRRRQAARASGPADFVPVGQRHLRRCAAQQGLDQHPGDEHRPGTRSKVGQRGCQAVHNRRRERHRPDRRAGTTDDQGDGQPARDGSERADHAEQGAQHRPGAGRRAADRRRCRRAARGTRQHGQGSERLRRDGRARPRSGAVRQAHAPLTDCVPQRPAQQSFRGVSPAAHQPAVRRRRQPAADHRGHERSARRGQDHDGDQPRGRARRGRCARVSRRGRPAPPVHRQGTRARRRRRLHDRRHRQGAGRDRAAERRPQPRRAHVRPDPPEPERVADHPARASRDRRTGAQRRLHDHRHSAAASGH